MHNRQTEGYIRNNNNSRNDSRNVKDDENDRTCNSVVLSLSTIEYGDQVIHRAAIGETDSCSLLVLVTGSANGF